MIGFEQALALNVNFRVAGPLQITAASNVAPDGKLRYSFGASTYLYRLSGMMLNANSDSFSIAKYVVQGMVKDDQQMPVEGAAMSQIWQADLEKSAEEGRRNLLHGASARRHQLALP